MDNVKDSREDSREADHSDSSALTSADNPAEEDTETDDPWAHIHSDEPGDTWEEYQDRGEFPPWI